MKRITFILTFAICSLFSQFGSVELSDHIIDYSFNPNKIKVNSTGYYLLDSDNRQLMYISNNDELFTAGGYGTTEESFIDPVSLMISNLKVYVVDGTENKVVIYDHKLNYLRTITFDEIYPTFCGIDDWGNIYLFSEIENIIFKLGETDNSISEFIDLSIYDIDVKSIIDICFTNDGEIAVLEENYLIIFNRLGNIELKIPALSEISLLVRKSARWFGVSGNNSLVDIFTDEESTLPEITKLLDLDYFNNQFYVLTKERIWIVDAALE